jgi:hypothetical protein
VIKAGFTTVLVIISEESQNNNKLKYDIKLKPQARLPASGSLVIALTEFAILWKSFPSDDQIKSRS